MSFWGGKSTGSCSGKMILKYDGIIGSHFVGCSHCDEKVSYNPILKNDND